MLRAQFGTWFKLETHRREESLRKRTGLSSLQQVQPITQLQSENHSTAHIQIHQHAWVHTPVPHSFPPTRKFPHLHTETETKGSLEAFVSKFYAMKIFKAKPPDLRQTAKVEGGRTHTLTPSGISLTDSSWREEQNKGAHPLRVSAHPTRRQDTLLQEPACSECYRDGPGTGSTAPRSRRLRPTDSPAGVTHLVDNLVLNCNSNSQGKCGFRKMKKVDNW